MTGKNYIIIRAHDPDILAEQVETKTVEGWEPVGGLAVAQYAYGFGFCLPSARVLEDARSHIGTEFMQAMVRRRAGAGDECGFPT